MNSVKVKAFWDSNDRGYFAAKPGGPAGLQAVRVENILDDTPAQKVGLRMGRLDRPC